MQAAVGVTKYRQIYNDWFNRLHCGLIKQKTTEKKDGLNNFVKTLYRLEKFALVIKSP